MGNCIHDFIQEMNVRNICTQCGKTEVKILQEENAALLAENTVQWKNIKTLNREVKRLAGVLEYALKATANDKGLSQYETTQVYIRIKNALEQYKGAEPC